MARVLKGSQFYLHTHPQSEWPAFAFPTIVGTHLPTPEGWKAELARVAGYVVRQYAWRHSQCLNCEKKKWRNAGSEAPGAETNAEGVIG